MTDKVLLKDQLFNAASVQQLAHEFANGIAAFDAERFQREALAGFADRELMQRLEWLADCVEPYLSPDFLEMANQIEAAMPAPLDPSKTDDDFGHFIHAVPGILAVRHGLEAYPDRALDLIYAATQRFSMEFYIRPFLNRWPDKTLQRLGQWAKDPNYHVRRLVSEGTRPKLPWAKAINLKPEQSLPLLDILYADPTRFVTRSVANHLNDVSKTQPDLVLGRLDAWQGTGLQGSKELNWMTRHALRSLIKQGHEGALHSLGYHDDLELCADLTLDQAVVRIGADMTFQADISCPNSLPVLVDYILRTPRQNGALGAKTFKLKTGHTSPGKPFSIRKKHAFKANATTFQLYPGQSQLLLQVNGRVVAQCDFELLAADDTKKV